MDAIRAGNYYEPTCAYAGIDYTTFRKCMQKGEKARKGTYFEFFEAVKQAEAEAEASMVALWQKQIPENWQAARDFLERRYPDRWGRREVNVNMNQNVTVTAHHEHDVIHRIAADPEARELVRRLYDRVASGREDAGQG